MSNHTRELLLVAALSVFIGRELASDMPSTARAAGAPLTNNGACVVYDTKRTAIGQAVGNGWEPFANGGNGQSVLWRKCRQPTSRKDAWDINRRQLSLGARPAVTKAIPVLARWRNKVVVFETAAGPISGKLSQLVGPQATVEWNGTSTTVNLLQARSVLLD